MVRAVNLLFVFLVVASVTEARIKFKKINIEADPSYLKIHYSVEEKNDIPYLTCITEVLQDIDGEIIVSLNAIESVHLFNRNVYRFMVT